MAVSGGASHTLVMCNVGHVMLALLCSTHFGLPPWDAVDLSIYSLHACGRNDACCMMQKSAVQQH